MHTEKPAPDADSEAAIQEALAAHPGLTREQLLKHLARAATHAEAARAPFPGPLREAFAGTPRTVFGYTLQPVNLALLCALEKIESPFIPMVEIIGAMVGKPSHEVATAIEQKLKPTTEQLLATVYCFITPIDEVEAELEKGSASFHKLAKKNIGRKHAIHDLGKLNAAILDHYIDSFKTSVDYRAKRAEGDHSFPSAPVESKTDSAGASISAEP